MSLRPASIALAIALALATGASGAIGVAAGGGCASVLGFEDTTLRAAGEAGAGDGGPNDEGGPAVDGGVARLGTTPERLLVRRGESVDVTVAIVREGIAGAITARLTDLPAGVTATTATLDAATSSATLKLSATAMATLGPVAVKLVAEGTSLPASDVPLVVADAPGSFDTTWDGDGLVVDGTRNAGATFFTLAVQPDQRVLAGGSAGAPLTGWMLRRFLPSGVADAAFNALGVGLPIDGEIRAIATLATGKIVCVGASAPAAAMPTQATIVRLDAAGAIDKTFGAPTGVVRLPAEAPGTSTALGVAVQPDGAVIVVGLRRDAGGLESGIITRFKSDGVRDPTFNGGATIVTPGARYVGVTIEGEGILVAGSSTNAGSTNIPSYVLTRRTAQGANDNTFANAGTATFGNTFRATSFARLPDGLLAVAGDVNPPGQASYTAGVMTTKVITQFTRGFATLPGAAFYGVAAQDATRVVAVGHTAVVNGEARVGRFSALDGKPDPTFSDAGTATIEPGGVANNFEVALYAAAVEGSGRILAAGNRSNAGAVIYRLWP